MTVHRRYRAGVHNFFELYAPIAYRWKFTDNTEKPGFLIASGGEAIEEEIFNAELWAKLKEEYKHG